MGMKRTLLEMTQDILLSMQSDSVNGISDTQESLQVASIIEQVYWDLMASLNFPEHFGLFELLASGDNTQPTIMTLPTDALELHWVKYNNIKDAETAPNYLDVQWKDLKNFMDDMYAINTDNSNVISFTRTLGGDPIDILCYNDRMPQYYTSFDDNTLIFDSYDADEDTTLVKAKTSCWGLLEPTFTQSDSFIPDLDAKQFPLFFNNAKAQCFAEIKQTSNDRAERTARDHKVTSQKHKFSAKQPQPTYDRVRSYGRI